MFDQVFETLANDARAISAFFLIYSVYAVKKTETLEVDRFKLSRALGVGRKAASESTIRSALQRLVREGFLDSFESRNGRYRVRFAAKAFVAESSFPETRAATGISGYEPRTRRAYDAKVARNDRVVADSGGPEIRVNTEIESHGQTNRCAENQEFSTTPVAQFRYPCYSSSLVLCHDHERREYSASQNSENTSYENKTTAPNTTHENKTTTPSGGGVVSESDLRDASVVSDAIRTYHRLAPSLPHVKICTSGLREELVSVLRRYGALGFTEAVRKAEESDFLSGRTGQFRASLRWILRNVEHILAGKYDTWKRRVEGSVFSMRNTERFEVERIEQYNWLEADDGEFEAVVSGKPVSGKYGDNGVQEFPRLVQYNWLEADDEEIEAAVSEKLA